MLLVGALCGLFGLQAAYAIGPIASPTVMAAAHATPMGADCVDMAMQQQGQKQPPCKGLTVENAAPAVDRDRLPGEPEFWPAVIVLAGGTISPEPHPPSSLI